MDNPSDVFHYTTTGGLGLVLLKQAWDFILARKAKDDDTTEEALKAINSKLDTIVNALHAHDTSKALLEARLESMEREVKELRIARHELVQQVASNKARLELLAEKIQELRGAR